jgi:hypothetical protein
MTGQVFGVFLGTVLLVAGEEPAGIRLPNVEGLTNTPLRQVSANVFELGDVRLDKALRTVTIPACVNMSNGLVEYLLVGKDGKLHESVFRTDVQPACVHVAMLLIGVKGAPEDKAPPPEAGAFYVGPGKPGTTSITNAPPLVKGDPVTIRVIWQLSGEGRSVRGEDCVWNKKTRSAMSAGDWVYTGSRVINGTFLAQRDQSLISIVPDASSLVSNPRPDRQNDEIWEACSKILPPDGTSVQIILQLEKPKAADSK